MNLCEHVKYFFDHSWKWLAHSAANVFILSRPNLMGSISGLITRHRTARTALLQQIIRNIFTQYLLNNSLSIFERNFLKFALSKKIIFLQWHKNYVNYTKFEYFYFIFLCDTLISHLHAYSLKKNIFIFYLSIHFYYLAQNDVETGSLSKFLLSYP